ncbi:TetR/AcrR family transcriptional regulator [Gemmatimonas sp.]|uniref:TetR/AcrR family transcriptional regulator n=1 Tax=Gemmatimonas sp. TaxID=1962908 RepID=UPI0033424AAD
MTTSAIRSASLARRERQKAETRQAILDAARELFVAEGVEATTMRAIAAKIGYTPTAIYHHFRDKDALIVELCLADFTALGQAMFKIGRIEDPVERLRRMGMAYADFALDNPSQYRFMFMTSYQQQLNDASGNMVPMPDEDAYQFLFQTVQEGIDKQLYRPELTDAVEMAQMFWGGIHGIVALWFTHCDNPHITFRDPRQAVRTMCDSMIRGSVRNPA